MHSQPARRLYVRFKTFLLCPDGVAAPRRPASGFHLCFGPWLAGGGMAQAQSYTIPVSGGGTLTYSYSQQSTCDGGFADQWYGQTYTAADGTATAANFGITYLSSAGCGITGGWDSNGNGSTNGNSNSVSAPVGYCTLTFNASIDDPYGQAYISCPQSYQGFINPKYIVVAVTYAPPGTSSYVKYSETTSVGNTIDISSSFSNDVGFSVSVNGSIQGWVAGLDGTAGVKATSSTNYTQESNSSTTTTLSKETTVAYQTPGTPTMSPVNNDYDYIWLWLNPEVLLNYTPETNTGPAAIQWNGYGYDPNDPAGTNGPDVFPVQVGCLNGHFSCPNELTWAYGGPIPRSYVLSGTLSRAWVSGQTWPSGEMPNLTINDICQILTYDPLAQSPASCSNSIYTGFSGFPETTPDERYTQDTYPPNPIPYSDGGVAVDYNLVQMNTQSVANGSKNTITQAFGLEESFGGHIFGIGVTTKLNQSDTLTWTNSRLDTITSTTTLKHALSVTGPPDGSDYTGPDQFIAYQDNLFGTFAFVPIPAGQ